MRIAVVLMMVLVSVASSGCRNELKERWDREDAEALKSRQQMLEQENAALKDRVAKLEREAMSRPETKYISVPVYVGTPVNPYATTPVYVPVYPPAARPLFIINSKTNKRMPSPSGRFFLTK